MKEYAIKVKTKEGKTYTSRPYETRKEAAAKADEYRDKFVTVSIVYRNVSDWKEEK